jgi:hypothetical protein
MSDSDPPDPQSSPEVGAAREEPRAASSPMIEVVTSELLLPGTEPLDPYQEILDRLHQAVAAGMPPDLLRLGGEEALDAYREVFGRVFRSKPIFDPDGRAIVFGEHDCRHICICEERFDKRRKRAEGEDRVREYWDQSRAEHILWLLPALTAPSLIVRNNQQEGNLAYLLGYPTGNHTRPSQRYYASVTPKSPKRAIFKTAYTITQEQWDQALRVPKHRRGQDHVLYRGCIHRW